MTGHRASAGAAWRAGLRVQAALAGQQLQTPDASRAKRGEQGRGITAQQLQHTRRSALVCSQHAGRRVVSAGVLILAVLLHRVPQGVETLRNARQLLGSAVAGIRDRRSDVIHQRFADGIRVRSSFLCCSAVARVAPAAASCASASAEGTCLVPHQPSNWGSAASICSTSGCRQKKCASWRSSCRA